MRDKQKTSIFVVFGFFILLLSGWFVFSAMGVVKSLQTLSWPHTQGTVLLTDIQRFPSSKGPIKYSPVIRYLFTVGTNEYSSEQYSRTIARGTMDWAKHIIDQHPVNSIIQVYYKPENPAISILKTGLQSDDYWMFSISSFFLFVVILAFKKQLRQTKEESDILHNQKSL